MPALPPMPSISSPKVTPTLVNTDGLAEGLKKFTPAETSPYTSRRSSLRVKLVPVETSVVLLSSERVPHKLPVTNGSMVVPVHACTLVPTCGAAPRATTSQALQLPPNPALPGLRLVTPKSHLFYWESQKCLLRANHKPGNNGHRNARAERRQA